MTDHDFYRPREAPARGNPAEDPPMVVRVHPDDDPRDPQARRVIRTDDPRSPQWLLVTGWHRASPPEMLLNDTGVADWPVTHPVVWGSVFRHAAADDRRHARTLDGHERGDMDVTAFKG